MTVKEIYNRITEELSRAGIDDATSEAGIILRETAGFTVTDMHMRPDTELDESVLHTIETIISRRLMREPLQYIYGRWNFMGLDFCVEKEVLIPRSDTEILVESALKEIHDGMRILDLCTGTGCILISLLKYSNGCPGVGVDIAKKAVELARKNSEFILGCDIDEDDATQVQFLEGDLYKALDGSYDNSGEELFDIIVSNPPYIKTDVISTLEPEVKGFEPVLALDGGSDGLDIIRRIIAGADEHLIKGGSLFIEIGYDQGDEVSSLLTDAGFIDVEVIKDYAGLDRVVRGRRPILQK